MAGQSVIRLSTLPVIYQHDTKALIVFFSHTIFLDFSNASHRIFDVQNLGLKYIGAGSTPEEQHPVPYEIPIEIKLSALSITHNGTCIQPISCPTAEKRKQSEKAPGNNGKRVRQEGSQKGGANDGNANGANNNNNDNKNNDGGDSGGRGGGRRKNKPDGPRHRRPSTGLLACPFYKCNPELHSTCPPFSRFSDLTQHLERNHTLSEYENPPYCTNCRIEFHDDNPVQRRDDHVRLLDSPSGACQRETACTCGMMLPDEMRAYKQAVSHASSRTDVVARWNYGWESIFASPPPPSPYFESLATTTEGACRRRMQEILPTALQSFFRQLGLSVSQSVSSEFIENTMNRVFHDSTLLNEPLVGTEPAIVRPLQAYAAQNHNPLVIHYSHSQAPWAQNQNFLIADVASIAQSPRNSGQALPLQGTDTIPHRSWDPSQAERGSDVDFFAPFLSNANLAPNAADPNYFVASGHDTIGLLAPTDLRPSQLLSQESLPEDEATFDPGMYREFPDMINGTLFSQEVQDPDGDSNLPA